MKLTKKSIISVGVVLVAIIIFLLVDKVRHRSGSDHGHLHVSSNGDFRSSSGSSSSEPSFTNRKKQIDRNPEHEALFESSLLGDEALKNHARRLLAEDETKALELFGKLTADLNYDAIGDVLVEHFVDSGRTEDGLNGFELLDPNPDLAVPLLARFLLPYWKESPEKAFSYLEKWPEFNGIEESSWQIGQEIGKNGDFEPEKHAEILNGSYSEDVRSNYFEGLAKTWLEKDYKEAFEYFSQLEYSPVLDAALYEMVETSAPHDPAASMAWAETLTDEGLRKSAMEGIVNIWKKTDLEGYNEWKSQR